MKDLSLHVQDIAENSVRAGASLVTITVTNSARQDRIILRFEDNGKGMSPELLARVTDPFTTTRTTRRVGLGLPLFKDAAEQTGGSFSIESTLGVGTVTTAEFVRSSIDTPPEGDLCGAVLTLIQGAPEIDFLFTYQSDKGSFVCDTREIRELLGGVGLDEPPVLAFLSEYLREHVTTLQ